MEYERTTGGAAGCEIPHDPRAHRRIYQSDLCGADHGRSVPDDFYHDYRLLFWGAGSQKRVKREIKGMELSAGIFADGRELSFLAGIRVRGNGGPAEKCLEHTGFSVIMRRLNIFISADSGRR
mgnify:FL=1